MKLLTALLLVLACLPDALVHAQKKKPPTKAKKPLARKAATAKPGGPIVLGTTQLPGDFGKFGQTYTIGKSSPSTSLSTQRNTRCCRSSPEAIGTGQPTNRSFCCFITPSTTLALRFPL